MARAWRAIRVPAELAERIEALAGSMLADHVEMRATLPGQYCESVPLHFAIERAVADFEAHRDRSRAPRRRAARHTAGS